jgi:hypothetical protein
MTRYHQTSNGPVAFTAEEEATRDAEETAWNMNQAAKVSAEAAETTRIAAYKNDTGCIDTLNKMSNMTFAEFDAWFDANVTTLAQARVALKRLAWVVLLMYKDEI